MKKRRGSWAHQSGPCALDYTARARNSASGWPSPMAVRRQWVKENTMPDLRREFDPRDPLDEALDAVRRDDAATEIPARIEHHVMLAWDGGMGGTSHRRRRSAPIWFGAIAASVLFAAIAFSRYQAGLA